MDEKPKTKKQLDNETARLLKSVIDSFAKEDIETRQRQVRLYQQLKLYWNNMSNIYWDAGARDYKLAFADNANNDADGQAYYDQPVNVFKAFLETIIAALSIQIPAVSCIPDDADNPDDLSTARAGDILGEQIYKQNEVIFLWLHALYVHCTEGLIACHHYPKEDEEYGTYEEEVYKDVEGDHYVCPGCGYVVDDVINGLNATSEMEEAALPTDEQIPEDAIELDMEDDDVVCPQCKANLDPELEKTKKIVSTFAGTEKRNKVRICMEVYGGLYVRVANYAKRQADTPFLAFEYDTHYANAIERYPHIKDDLPKSGSNASSLGSSYDPFEQSARLNPQYHGNIPNNNVTVRNWWLRPAAFNVLTDEDAAKLKTKFPSGAHVALVNEICADYCDQSLDSRWTLSRNPMSDYLTHQPLGQLLMNIQDIVNDLISLVLQTIEHGVVQTWADPSVVSFDGQRQIEANPGMITSVLAQGSNKNISDAFFSTSAATLSPEVFNFYRIVQELGQFISGALPSLFGGNPGSNSSQTASEYAMSKGMAMQRLQNPWKMMTLWWKTIFGKVIPQYMAEMIQDEKFVQRKDKYNYVNVIVRKADTTGKLGSVELDAAEQVPVTDEQKAEIVMQLLALNNAEIQSAFASPENLPFIRKIVKLPQFMLPGEDDRQKQYEEIQKLLNSAPLEYPTAMPETPDAPPIEIPSVEVDPILDNHVIEAEICRIFLISEAGRLAKVENPKGYKNVLLHMKAHMQIIAEQAIQAQMQQAQAMAQATPNPQGGKEKPPGKPGESNVIKGEQDVNLNTAG